MSVMIIGDMHLKSVSPISRKDDYPKAILNKINYLGSIAKGYRCKTIILLGDVFDSPSTSLPYLASVISTFKKLHDEGYRIITIAGNHDLKNNRMESLESTALGILLSTGYVELAPSELKIENTLFRFYNYPESIEPKKTDSYEICVAHQYYEFELGGNDSLTKETVENLNYDAMILGHYHVPCETITIGNTILYRPGSLSRSTSEMYNKTRIPRALILNTKNHKSMYVDVSCSPADEIFIEKVESNRIGLSMKDLIQFMTTSYSTSDMDVRDYFNQLEIPYECRCKIARYLDTLGV